jgi:hypothetical protein
MSKSIEAVEQEFYNHFLKMDKNSYGLIKIWKYLEEHVFSQFKESQPTEVERMKNIASQAFWAGYANSSLKIDAAMEVHNEWLSENFDSTPNTQPKEDVEDMFEVWDKKWLRTVHQAGAKNYGRDAFIAGYNAAKKC